MPSISFEGTHAPKTHTLRESLTAANHVPPLTTYRTSITPQLTQLRSLVCNSENRLGRSGAHELKSHPFFAGVDFDNLRRFRAPFEPRLTSDIDTAYFPTEDLEQQAAAAMEIDGGLEAAAAPEPQETPEMTLPFIGYTFKRFENNFR